MDNNTSYSIGPGGVIFIVLLILKLTDLIDWSWWWVTAPIWIAVVVALVRTILYIKSAMNKRDGLASDIKESKFLIKLHEVMEKNDKLSKLN
jgi:hypothetical protein